MSIARIKKDDTVIAIAGDDAGKTGKVLRVLPKKGMAVVQGLHIVKKAIRSSRSAARTICCWSRDRFPARTAAR